MKNSIHRSKYKKNYTFALFCVALICATVFLSYRQITKVDAQEAIDLSTSATDSAKSSKQIQPVEQPASPAASYSNTTPFTITDCPSPCPVTGQAASLYPSSIPVAGEVGVVQRVSVTLNGFSHSFPSDVDMLLVSPSGRKSVIMSDFGAGAPGVSNINVTLDDYAERPVPSTVTGNNGFPFTTGTYRPSNAGTTDQFPAPAPAGPYTYTMSAFNGDDPNGIWSLYVIDDANLDGGSVSGGWTITFDVRPPAPAAGDILISEFRTRGVGTSPPASDGAADEFIELYNNTDSSITIIDAIPGADPTLPAGAGWRISGAQGAAETTFLILPQTLSTTGPLAIQPRGHFLITTAPTTPSPAGNTYSLSAYPTGTGITSSGTTNIGIDNANAATGFLPDDVGIAIFSTANALATNRLDSVGFSSVTNSVYKEGAGLSPANGITTPSQHSFVRKMLNGLTQDTNNNAADFVLVETTGAILNGIQSILGAPGPERAPLNTSFTTSSAPVHSQTTPNMTVSLIDPTVSSEQSPNRVYNPTPVTNGANGTLKLRRTITNTTGAPILALRYRVVDINTVGNRPMNFADLRVLNSPAQPITTAGGNVTTDALNLQMPPAQSIGGTQLQPWTDRHHDHSAARQRGEQVNRV